MKFFLKCNKCNFSSQSNKNLLYCPTCQKDSLLKTVYTNDFKLRGPINSFNSYMDWMPFNKIIFKNNAKVSCFKPKILNKLLGLNDLWILFSGYSKKYDSSLVTCTFKETEAIGVTSRVLNESNKTLIISSAGNAAKAFLEYGSQINQKSIVIIPEHALKKMRIKTKPRKQSPLLICIKNAFYMDAIRLVNKLLEKFPEELVKEGGCYNVARRDAMAMPFLSAAYTMKSIPDRYIQAVGSGTGGLAAAEGAKRLRDLPNIEKRKMKLHLVQNSPFQPIVDAWNNKSKEIQSYEDTEVYDLIQQTKAKVLSNVNPPYSVKGGLYDALLESNGDTTAVTNLEIDMAKKLSSEILGLDLCSPASAALAGLVKAVNLNALNKNEKILLHLTGGGGSEIENEVELYEYPSVKKIDLNEIKKAEEIVEEYLAN